jgi:CRISPR-associated endonuclease Csn1
LKKYGLWPDYSEKKTAFEIYQSRFEALSQQIVPEDMGRILMLFNKYRGFKSSRKVVEDVEIEDQEKDDEEGKIATEISWLKGRMATNNCTTVGEYFYRMFQKSQELYDKSEWHNADEPFDERGLNEPGEFVLNNSRGIRREGRHVERALLEQEFDLIWQQQQQYYPQLTGNLAEYQAILNQKNITTDARRQLKKNFQETTYWQLKHHCIFYQRPLKSAKRFVGKCGYEPSKRCVAASSFVFQEFRILKNLTDLRLTDPRDAEVFNKPLDDEQRGVLFGFLQNNARMTFTQVKEKLGLSRLVKINIDQFGKTGLQGNQTRAALLKALGEPLFDELEISTDKFRNLHNLWHALYMSKDEQWLKETLMDSQKWHFDEETTRQLVAVSLAEGYGNMSSKVLSKMIPPLKKGLDERAALETLGYLNRTSHLTRPLKNKVSDIKNNELRNPVVEKAMMRVVRLVNSLIKKHDIDPEQLTIRIESTRELKKPKKERENITKKNLETENRRKDYAVFLTKSGFFGVVFPESSLIHKFELWKELGSAIDDDKKDAADFEKFVKDLKYADLSSEKHRLWIEQNFKCPYTLKPIPLAALASADIEIEHIIPYSRSMDNSFINKTLCYAEANREKGALTAFEFKRKQGTAALETYKKHIQEVFKKSEDKQKRFMLETVEQNFNPNQLTNTSYIARAIKTKLQDVSRDVQFTNGAATAELRKHWKIGRLLQEVMYEEETGIEMWRHYGNRNEDANKAAIKVYETWLEQFGRGKNRSDHRHHAVDALVIGLCSPAIIQQISTFNRVREEMGIYEHDGTVSRNNETYQLPPLPIRRSVIKEALKKILVSSAVPQRLVVAQKNRIEASDKPKQRTFSVRGNLHDANYFGKLKNPAHQGIDKKEAFVKRIALNAANFPSDKAIKEKVFEPNIQAILLKRLEKYGGDAKKAFSDDNLMADPVFMYSLIDYPNDPPTAPTSKAGQPLPIIKKVRTVSKNARSFVNIPAKDQNSNVINENRYAEKDGNYIMAFYEKIEILKKGKTKTIRDFRLVSGIEAVQQTTRDRKEGEPTRLFPDEVTTDKGQTLPLMKTCPSLKKGDFVVFFEDNADEIQWNDPEDLFKRLYQVTGMSSMLLREKDEYGTMNFVKHNASKANAKYENGRFEVAKLLPHIILLHGQLNAVKVSVSQLGEVRPLVVL